MRLPTLPSVRRQFILATMFDSKDPFPLIREGEWSYQEEQAHSAEVDKWLGFETETIEKAIEKASAGNSFSENSPKVIQDQQLWIGLGTQRLQTPYMEIRRLLEKIKPVSGETVVDLGAAYGRMGLVIDRHFPGVNFIGYEFVDERVIEATRVFTEHRLTHARVERVDLSAPDFHMPAAPYYFLFDYGSRRAIEKTLRDLQTVARSRAITVIGRGRASRDAIEHGHPWLAGIHPPEHFVHYSIYRS